MPIVPNKRLVRFDEFLAFCKLQALLRDDAPHVVLFRGVVKYLDLTQEQACWLTLLYMAYYDDGSAWMAFNEKGVSERKRLPKGDWPINKQRRNLFGGRLRQHLQALHEIRPNLLDWLCKGGTWTYLLNQLQSVYGNGRWASFTTAEMLVHVADLPIKPDTYEIVGSSGPKRGLAYLGLPPEEQAAIRLHKRVAEHGLNVPAEVFESNLCNWYRMNRGTFYAGHNLDRQQGRLAKIEQLTNLAPILLWNIRRQVFNNRALGELQGWPGIDKPRMKVYAKTKQVLEPWEGRV